MPAAKGTARTPFEPIVLFLHILIALMPPKWISNIPIKTVKLMYFWDSVLQLKSISQGPISKTDSNHVLSVLISFKKSNQE